MAKDDIYQASLEYHSRGRPGKIAVIPTKPTLTQRDLSLAYSPGVAEPCREIARNPDEAFKYTARGNLVAVVSNGTAILGIGNLGALASKPVMEGKGVLFKKFADIDVFDIEVDTLDIDEFVDTVARLEPTFGGINLEDIRAPECFDIERKLKERMQIPVMHDDQHGTAIISGAALLNAAEVTGRKLSEIKVVVNGAGASGIACTNYMIGLGVKAENVIMCDSKGVLNKKRDDELHWSKLPFVRDVPGRYLADVMDGADMLLGLSVKGAVKPEMLKRMAKNPIVFAMANPDPEIDYPEAIAARPDLIMATGRSDFPNQVNNVLGFPFIFRGALDTRAKAINEEMKRAATMALAKLAKAEVPDSVSRAYGGEKFHFGRNYLIPKPFDPRVLYYVAPAVAQAAMDTGAARVRIDIEEYRENLRRRTEPGRAVMSVAISKAKALRKRLALPDATDARVIAVAHQVINEGIAKPVLIGEKARVQAAMDGFDEDLFEIIDPVKPPSHELLEQRLREHEGMFSGTELDSHTLGALMADLRMVDGMLSASEKGVYKDKIPAVLRHVGRRPGVRRIVGMHIMLIKDRALFFADTTLVIQPSAEDLADCARLCAEAVSALGITPRIAFVSYNNFGASPAPDAQKIRDAHELFVVRNPGIEATGPIQADIALEPEEFRGVVSAERMPRAANLLIFPNLDSANAAFRLVRVTAGAAALGPLLLGLRRPANVMPRGSTVQEAVSMAAITLAMPVLATESGAYRSVGPGVGPNVSAQWAAPRE
ncbi:MAG: NADP-dependent malic enzyme [Planctomycetes bacterium]|nr:NADP-dependent malic enzyme [Planctomycetota bacterium]